VFVIGGSPGLTGAVCLCAMSALKIGAGLVTTGVPRSLNNIFEIKLTEIMSLPLADAGSGFSLAAFNAIDRFSKKTDVLAIGPGAGLRPLTRDLIQKVVSSIDKPMVVDADGLTALALNLKVLARRKARKIVLTPHLGEFSRLVRLSIDTVKKRRKELVKEFALRYNLTLVLKGCNTLISDGEKIFENKSGNPGMATAGMGDVLSGIIAGLMAQGITPCKAARFGVYIHGLAGDLAVKDKTQNCLIASDIIDYLPKAIKKL